MTHRPRDPFQTLSDVEDWTNCLLGMERQAGFSPSAPMAYSEKDENLIHMNRSKAWGTYPFLAGMVAALYLMTQPLLNSSVTSTRWLAGLTVGVLAMTLLAGWIFERHCLSARYGLIAVFENSKRVHHQPKVPRDTQMTNHSTHSVWNELSNMLETRTLE